MHIFKNVLYCSSPGSYQEQPLLKLSPRPQLRGIELLRGIMCLTVDWMESMATPQKEVQKRYRQDQKRYQRQIEKNKKILAKRKAA